MIYYVKEKKVKLRYALMLGGYINYTLNIRVPEFLLIDGNEEFLYQWIE